MNQTVTALQKQQKASAKNDSQQIMTAMCKLVDIWNKKCDDDVFLEKTVTLLSTSKNLLWRPHWLKLRRHILEILEEI